MNVIYVKPLSLRVSKKKARKQLHDLVSRGERLVRRMRRYTEPGHENVALYFWQNWYNSCILSMRYIFPTDREEEIVFEAKQTGAGWVERVQHVVDGLKDILNSVDNFTEPPFQTTFVSWLREQKGLMRVFNATGYFAAYCVGEFRPQILEWLRSLLK